MKPEDKDIRMVALIAAALICAGRGGRASANTPVVDALLLAREFEKYIKEE